MTQVGGRTPERSSPSPSVSSVASSASRSATISSRSESSRTEKPGEKKPEDSRDNKESKDKKESRESKEKDKGPEADDPDDTRQERQEKQKLREGKAAARANQALRDTWEKLSTGPGRKLQASEIRREVEVRLASEDVDVAEIADLSQQAAEAGLGELTQRLETVWEKTVPAPALKGESTLARTDMESRWAAFLGESDQLPSEPRSPLVDLAGKAIHQPGVLGMLARSVSGPLEQGPGISARLGSLVHELARRLEEEEQSNYPLPRPSPLAPRAEGLARDATERLKQGALDSLKRKQVDEKERKQSELSRQEKGQSKTAGQVSARQRDDSRPRESTGQVGGQHREDSRPRESTAQQREDSRPRESTAQQREDSRPRESTAQQRDDSRPRESTGQKRDDSHPRESTAQQRDDSHPRESTGQVGGQKREETRPREGTPRPEPPPMPGTELVREAAQKISAGRVGSEPRPQESSSTGGGPKREEPRQSETGQLGSAPRPEPMPTPPTGQVGGQKREDNRPRESTGQLSGRKLEDSRPRESTGQVSGQKLEDIRPRESTGQMSSQMLEDIRPRESTAQLGGQKRDDSRPRESTGQLSSQKLEDIRPRESTGQLGGQKLEDIRPRESTGQLGGQKRDDSRPRESTGQVGGQQREDNRPRESTGQVGGRESAPRPAPAPTPPIGQIGGKKQEEVRPARQSSATPAPHSEGKLTIQTAEAPRPQSSKLEAPPARAPRPVEATLIETRPGRPEPVRELRQTLSEVRPEPVREVRQALQEARPEPVREVRQTLPEVRPEPVRELRQTLSEARPEPVREVRQALQEARPEAVREVRQALQEARPEPVREVRQALQEVRSEPVREVRQALQEARSEPVREVRQALSEVRSEPVREVRQALQEARPEPVREVRQALQEAHPEPVREVRQALQETRPEPVREVRRALQDVRPEPVGDVPHNLTKALNPEQVRPALHEEREAQATQPIRQTTEQVEPAAEGIRPTTTPRRRTEPERQASPEPPSMGSEEAAAQGVPPRESPRPPAGAPIEAVQAIGLEPRRTTLTELAQEVRQKQQSTPFYKSTPRPPQMPAYGPELESGEAEEPVLGLQVGAYRETEMRRLELRLGHLEETEEHREGRREDGEEQERQRREEEERQERQEAEEEGADADEDEDCDPEPEFALPGEAPGSDASPPELGGLNLGSETHSLTLDGLQAGGGPDLADLGAGSDDLAGLAPGGINQTSARSGEADYLLAATAGLAPLQARRVTALITEYRFTALEARQAVQLGLAPEQSGLTPDEARRAVALCLRSGLTAEQAWKSVTSGLPTTAERHRSGLGLAPRHDEGPLEPPDELAALGFHPGALGHDLRLDDPTGVGLRDLSVDPATRLQRARERKNPPAQAPPVVQAPPETPLEVVEVERGWLAGIVPRRPDPLEWACSPGRTFFWSVTPALNAPLVGVATWARFRRSPWQLDLRKVAPSLESGVPLPHFFAQMVPWLDSRMMAHFYSRATRFISSYAATLLRKAREKRRQLSEEEILNYLLGLLALGGEFTHQHSVRVMKLSIALCRELGMTDRETLRQIGLSALLKDIGEVDLMIERSPKSYGQRVTNFLTGQDLHKAGLLHDLGKLKVPHEILYKPGALTQEEFAVMKMHPIYSEEILWPFLYFRPLCPIVRGHHERWDGKGYPDGLKGEEIPIGARIIALADVFDALFADRPYRAGMPLEKVCKIIAEGRGTHFDPSLVDPFLKAVKTLKLEGQAAPHP